MAAREDRSLGSDESEASKDGHGRNRSRTVNVSMDSHGIGTCRTSNATGDEACSEFCKGYIGDRCPHPFFRHSCQWPSITVTCAPHTSVSIPPHRLYTFLLAFHSHSIHLIPDLDSKNDAKVFFLYLATYSLPRAPAVLPIEPAVRSPLVRIAFSYHHLWFLSLPS
ncbi:hypothetical protein BCR44DRAFT_34373 [Catenaria anguillulae PL171]|uniref:Uncharacterized protein n=1 Tax=Catenaria anguillulae PL171 TaxID=765915 RepID=A0A1Y2HKU5_9FUNG|nr:hypothetical protein BCR44DRAFT_34373 [Catenaria anguillulae PL171]